MNIIKGPYLQFNRSKDMLVLWETDDAGASRVDYGVTEELGHYVEQTELVTLHRVELSGLEPETTYHYRIRTDDASSDTFTFCTEVNESTPFIFAAFGDSRTTPEQSSAVGRQMASHEPHFLLHSGDLVSNGTAYEQWEEQFFAPLGGTLAHVPIFPVLGNHEQNSEHFYNFFPSGSWYAFNYGCAQFIALDTNTASGGFAPGTEQHAWLEQTLAETDATWRIVWFHHPPYSSGNHGCSFEQREAFAPLFEKYKVDMVFNGHDHIYERSFRMQANERVGQQRRDLYRDRRWRGTALFGECRGLDSVCNFNTSLLHCIGRRCPFAAGCVLAQRRYCGLSVVVQRPCVHFRTNPTTPEPGWTQGCH